MAYNDNYNIVPQPNTIDSVTYIREDLKRMLRQYELINDCIEGEQQVKHRRSKYLPMPNRADQSIENKERYEAYITRAVFYGATGRTLSGLIGQVFLRDPIIELPQQLEIFTTDATGSGISLMQLAKQAMEYVISMGRSGILSDYPPTNGTVTQADLASQEIRPVMNVYKPEDIINWRVDKRGAANLLTLVVLREDYFLPIGTFAQIKQNQYRVLSLDASGLYMVQIYRTITASGVKTGAFKPIDTYFPTDSKGNRLDEIPFKFIGAKNNDVAIDSAPLYDLASLNVAHYRNSADYEEACFICGQPTPYFSGLTTDWVEEVFENGTVQLGSRAAIPLPVGGTAGLLQAAPNSMPFEAMAAKERQMVALGAKLVEQNSVQRTAQEAVQENSSELSTLSSSAQNVGAAILWALGKCSLFAGTDPNANQFDLNTEFDLVQMSPQDRQQLLAEWQGGGITWGEYRANLRRGGIATEDDDVAKAEIAKDLATMPQLAPPTPDVLQGGAAGTVPE